MNALFLVSFCTRLVAFCVACAGAVGPQKAPDADRFERMDQYVGDAMEKWAVPGLAIAIVKDGEPVLTRSYGVCELGSDRRVRDDTLFPIASCTKSFTASCIAILVDEGTVQWDDPVRKHLPDFQVADPYVSEHATIRDLLCHRTGLVRGDLLAVSGGFTRAEMLKQIRFLPQAAQFRSKVTYNNLMFAVLGEIIEKKSGMSWHEFVTGRLLEPLQMRSTTTDRTAILAERLAVRHRFYDGELAPLRSPIYDQMAAPAGAIWSTVGDMATWLRFQLREGESDGRQMIRVNAMREMQAVQQSIPVKWRPDSSVYDPRFVGAGFGWYVRDYRGRKLIEHGGGWGADMAFVPEADLGVVILSNRDWNGLVGMLVYDVIDAYLVGPEQAWAKGDKWEHWLSLGGPDAMDRDRKSQRAALELNRQDIAHASLPLSEYAGTYQSTLYGDLGVTLVEDRLHAQFGDFTASLDHWNQDTFYGHAVVEPFLDWLVKFDLDPQGSVAGLEIIHVGWKDPDERFLFKRKQAVR